MALLVGVRQLSVVHLFRYELMAFRNRAASVLVKAMLPDFLCTLIQE